MQIRAVIVDDESSSRFVLGQVLREKFPMIQVVGEASGAEEAFGIINDLQPTLVFLDIQMPGKNGFDLLRMFRHIEFEIIFVTSYDKYAINAIRFSALDYLLKPINLEELSEALKRAQQHIAVKSWRQPHIINLLHNLDGEEESKRIMIHQGEKVFLLRTHDIILLKADQRYCEISTFEGQKYIASKPLKEFELFLSDHPDFVRINKTYMLNVKGIRSYYKGEPCIVEMTNGAELEISRRRKQEVLQRLAEINKS